MANKETNKTSMKQSAVVSSNSKRILWALFILVIVILLVFTITVRSYPDLTGRLNTVFIAAITGILALGGTLITQLWNKRTSNGLPSDAPIAILQAPDQVSSGQKVTLDASASKNYDTVEIIQTNEPKVTLTDIDATKKEFTAPQTQNTISLEFKAVAKKGDKQNEKELSIKVSSSSTQPSDAPIAILQAPDQVSSGQKVTLDASASKNYDTVEIIQTNEPKVTLTDIDATKKEFTAPQTQNTISLEFKAVAKKGDKQNEKELSIKVSSS